MGTRGAILFNSRVARLRTPIHVRTANDARKDVAIKSQRIQHPA